MSFQMAHHVILFGQQKINRNNFIFCLFCVPADGCHFQFSSEQKEKLLDFGDVALVIQDFHEFISRVANEAGK